MSEAVAPYCAGVVEGLNSLVGVVELVVVLLLVRLSHGFEGEPVAVAVFGVALVRRDQLGEHARKSVDLMPAQLRSRREVGRPLAQDPLQAEHEREAHLPFGAGLGAARLDLGERLVKRSAAGSAGGENLL